MERQDTQAGPFNKEEKGKLDSRPLSVSLDEGSITFAKRDGLLLFQYGEHNPVSLAQTRALRQLLEKMNREWFEDQGEIATLLYNNKSHKYWEDPLEDLTSLFEDAKFTLQIGAKEIAIVGSGALQVKRKYEGDDKFERKYQEIQALKRASPKFTVNGEIRDPTGLFFLEPTQSNAQLMSAIENGTYVMLQGHRGSGKSTRCLYALENQISYRSIWVSMQAGVVATDVVSFWSTFGKRFMDVVQLLNIPTDVTVNSAASFLDFFVEQKKKNVRIVLFLDEFDLLLYGSTDVLDSLLGSLRSMKEHRGPSGQYSLQAVIIIGPLSILQAGNRSFSPFNIKDAIESPYFTQEDTKMLFKQYIESTQTKLEDGIIEDIFDRARGHPGLTCFCGKQIHENLALGKSEVKLSEWLEYAVFSLPIDVPYAWATVGRLKKVIGMEPYLSFLIRWFMSSDKPKTMEDEKSQQLARELTSEGALKCVGTNIFCVPSPLIRAIIMRTVLSQRELKKPPPSVLPVKDDLVDVPTLLTLGLPLFDGSVMKDAVKTSYKKNECSGGVKGNVPDEHCYHLELATILRKWLPDTRWAIATEANAPSTDNHQDRFCDIVVSAVEGAVRTKRTAIELVAHARDGPEDRRGTVQEHFHRAATSYSKLPQVQEVWVINFTTRRRGNPWPKDSQVRAAHVWHDLAWTKAEIVFDNAKTSPVKITL